MFGCSICDPVASAVATVIRKLGRRSTPSPLPSSALSPEAGDGSAELDPSASPVGDDPEGPADDDDPPVTSSKPGGGARSTFDCDAAYAIASAPYGTPNLAKVSLDEINLSCSGVGPDFG